MKILLRNFVQHRGARPHRGALDCDRLTRWRWASSRQWRRKDAPFRGSPSTRRMVRGPTSPSHPPCWLIRMLRSGWMTAISSTTSAAREVWHPCDAKPLLRRDGAEGDHTFLLALVVELDEVGAAADVGDASSFTGRLYLNLVRSVGPGITGAASPPPASTPPLAPPEAPPVPPLAPPLPAAAPPVPAVSPPLPAAPPLPAPASLGVPLLPALPPVPPPPSSPVSPPVAVGAL
jgi:hypothetical protein